MEASDQSWEIKLWGPNGFWESIKNMGRKQKRPIPKEVHTTDGCITADLDDVIRKCGTDYGSLFSENFTGMEMGLYVKHIKSLNGEFENKINSFGSSMEFDSPFFR